MAKEKEPGIKQEIYNGIPQGGIEDDRFEIPVMAINLTVDNVPKKYREHLKNGGDKIES